jgi:hypothetical protein
MAGLGLERMQIGGSLQHDFQVGKLDRFLVVVEGAELDRADHALASTVAREHDDLGRRRRPHDLVEHFETALGALRVGR